MTFCGDKLLSPSQVLVTPHRRVFSDWEKDYRRLFEYDDDEDLEFQIFVFMKRLHQQYESILLIPTEERLRYFRAEKDIMEKEKESNKPNNLE